MTAPDLLTPVWTATEPPRWSARDWETVLAQARRTRLAARLAHRFQTLGWSAGVPEGPGRHLESAARMADRLQRDVGHEVDLVVAALRDVVTPVVLLKGAAYVAAGLPPAHGRLFSDIDILVRRDQLAAVEDALFAAGWMPEKLAPYDDRYYRKWMHELPPLQHVTRHTSLDVHHTITPPTSRFPIDGLPLIERSRAIGAGGRLRVLAAADMVLHSAVHLMQEGEFDGGLRDLLDIDDLLRLHGAAPGFWAELAARSRQLGVERPLGLVLHQLRRLFATEVPAGEKAAVDAALAGSMQPGATGALLTLALAPPAVDGRDRLSVQFAGWLLYVRSHWLRMPWYKIGPHLVRKGWARALGALALQPSAEPGRVQDSTQKASTPGRAV